LAVTDVSADRGRQFLGDREERRGCGISTRNQRLAAIHALARLIGLRAPALVEWCGQVRGAPFQKAPRAPVTYLEKVEMDAVRAAPGPATAQGRRDHAVLLLPYTTGARADEAAPVRRGDVAWPGVPDRDPASVLTRGQGNQTRGCPLWGQTVGELAALVEGRDAAGHVFRKRCGRPMTRFGIHTLVEGSAARASARVPARATKRVSPHTIRHTTATHLLGSGVDINTIRAWRGHVSLVTTNVYAEVDVEMTAKALANCEVEGQQDGAPRKGGQGLMDFLRTL
jgi:site-specific recombinase XerD